MDIIQRHGDGKPVLVFCSTRKGAQGAAETLFKEYGKLQTAKKAVPWSTTKYSTEVLSSRVS